MPTYTGGFGQGRINLDNAPGFTGAVNEAFRLLPETKRTASAFFSFAARGPDAENLSALRPTYAWGDRSVFDWIHTRDAHLLMIGVPLHMCSFLHRVEWLGRVPYRYNKGFKGRIILNGKEEDLTEQLFVRSYDPMAENIWPAAEEILETEKILTKKSLGRGFVLHVQARALVDRLYKVLEQDPYAFVKNPDVLKAKFGMPTREPRRV
jgi:aminoglycoside N3'-acetyltransferase